MRQPIIGSGLQGRLAGKADVSRSYPSVLARMAAGILYAALAFPPLLFGAREPSTVAAWCALLGFGLIIAPLRRLERGQLLIIGGIAFVVLCFGFVLHEQLSDHPWIATFDPIWAKASEALGTELTPSVSVVRGEPFFALGRPLVNMLALVLGVIVGADPERARRGVRVMAWAGVGYATYGILVFFVAPTSILWREKTAYLGSLTATFINRNTAAAYFGSCAAVWLVLLMAAVRRRLPRGRMALNKMLNRLLADTPGEVLIRFVMFFVCLAAMLMTNSRGGTLASLVVMIIGFLMYFWRDVSWRSLAVALIGCAVLGLLLLDAFGSRVGSRIDAEGLSDAGRLSAYRSILAMIADHPWFGTGLGTFASAFPAYRSADISMWGVWGIGHSTPLEFASEMGLPLTAVVVLAWTTALVVLLRTLRWRRTKMAVPLSAFMVALIALLHSSIDFSLQITGYSIVVFALLGLGLSQASRSPSSEGER